MYYEDCLKRMSSFYVNEVHLITMLLPYMEKIINENGEIYTILQNSLDKTINLLLSRINLKQELKDKILAIDWKAKGIKECKKMEKQINKHSTNYIIINGNEKYIKEMNKQVKKFKIEKLENKNILINCYNIVEFNKNIIDILDNTDKILNTSGEHEIEDIFPEYVREKNNKIKKA